ncbi:MAG TPA: citrate/2-methylcitrate synthase [Candidatus Acidoferrales bacterium]|nr:citrate/2-methylcitrate synthase [Candidatus Acidoferrales bacterium]
MSHNSERAAMLTAAEAADQLGVKLGTLYAYVSRGWLRSYRRKVGRQALYRRADIDALRGVVSTERGRRGRSLPPASTWVTVAQPRSIEDGAPGVIVAESAVSSIIDLKLAYRGYPIEEVVEHASFEEVCLLLWSGERPVAEEIAALRAEIHGAQMPASVAASLAAVGDDAPPLLRMAAVMPTLAAWDRRQPPRTRIDRAKLIISLLPLALAEPPAVEAVGAIGMAGRLLGWAPGATGAEWEVAALDRVLVACAEHELNASTFAARVVASTGADLFASVLAALCSLSGPIHGGACDRIEAMFAELESGARLEECLAAFTHDHRLPPGFGHAIYPEGDPRAVLLRDAAHTVAKHRGRRLFETAQKVEAAVWKRERLRPNLDFYLTVCARMLGFPRSMPAAIFAIGRASGWIAHALEQYADNRLIRPRMRYRGAPLRHWD